MSWSRILADTAEAHGPQSFAVHLDVEPEPVAVRAARDAVRQQLAGYDQDVLDVILLLISELLTNAILYGRSGVCVDISVHVCPVDDAADGLRLGVWAADPVTAILVGVTDASSRLPQPRPSRDFPENGLGLQIVAQLANGWGTTPLGPAGGKIVWFLVNVRLPARA